MAVSGTSVGREGPPVRRLHEVQEPPGRNMSPQTRGAQNGSPGPGKSHGLPPTTTTRKGLGGETDTPENPRPPGFEIPFWIFGQQKWVSGVNRNTTCSEVVSVLFSQLGKAGTGHEEEDRDPVNFGLVEKWRKIERPLSASTKVLRVWQAWGEDKTEVRLVVKRTTPASPPPPPPGASSAAAGASGAGGREEGKVRRRRSRAVREERRRGDTLHPRSLQEDKEKCRDSIQRLMRVIISQGSTIQHQLAGLKEKEEAIGTFEDRMHQVRVAESGRDYLLHTYLGQLPPSPAGSRPGPLLSVSPTTSPINPRRSSSRHGNGLSSRPPTLPRNSQACSSRIPGAAPGGVPGGVPGGAPGDAPGKVPLGVPPDQLSQWTGLLEKVSEVNMELTSREEELVRLGQRARRLQAKGHEAKSRTVVPELEELLSIPAEALQKELCLSREEVETLITAITSTMDESKKVERELVAIQERQAAGDIYIHSLLADLQTAETEGAELQREFDWILTLPPSAFASPEMLEWLKRDLAAASSAASNSGDTDSELGLELSQSCAMAERLQFSALEDTSVEGRHILLPDQIHPMLNSSPNTTSGSDPARSSSTGSTSSGFSSDIHSLQSPEPTKPPLPPKRGISTTSKPTWNSSNPNLVSSTIPTWAAESLKLQNWDQTSTRVQEGTSNSPSLHIFGSPMVHGKGVKHEERMKGLLDEEEDCNSDTGLSSLNSSADDQFQLDTLV